MSDSSPQPRQVRKRIGRNVFDTPPRISVMITAYNQAAYLRETVESAIGQKYREHEIIVVNDGSEDTHQLELALKMRFDEIVYIRQRHAGAGAARNTGIEHARGDLIAFLNAGDVWEPDFLASQYIFLERHSLDLAYCDAKVFGMASPYRRTFMEKYPSTGEPNTEALLTRRCNVLISGTVARKDVIERAGMFEIGSDAKPAFNLWVRMAKCGARIGFQTKQLVKLRIYPDNPPDDSVERIHREKIAFESIRTSVKLNETESRIVDRRINDLESQIAAEQGHSFLKSGDYTEALTAFRTADRFHPSLKLKAISWLTRLAPRTASRFVEPNRHSNTELPHGRV